MVDRLTLSELVREADTTPERIGRLVAIGALKPAADGTFEPGDIIRSTLIDGFEQAGVGLDRIEQGLAERQMTLDYVELFYPMPGPRSDRTFAEFVASLGDRGTSLPTIIGAMGLVQPESDRHIGRDEEEILAAFLDAWDLPGDDVPARAARIAGESAVRLAQGWVGLFDETVSGPVADLGLTVDELVPRVVRPGGRVAALLYPLMAWLVARHLERVMNQLNIESIETALVRRGLAPAHPADPPAIVFADLSGYTRITEEQGDERAARVALRLAQLAVDAATAHDGRLVKLLGDGVMLYFQRPRQAVAAGLDLVASVSRAGLPPAHVGVDAGRVVARDGDYFGRTVNRAARISGQASAGEVLVSADLVEAVMTGGPDGPVRFEAVGLASLKGIAEPVELHRAHHA